MKKIKLVTLLIVIILSLSITPKPMLAKSNDLSGLPNFIDQLVKDYMENNQIPNASIVIVENGETIFQKGYGYANIKDSLPVDSEKSLFRIGSISKLFTWTAVMQLVEKDKLDLDTDINEYIDFNIPHEILNNKNSAPKPITLRHLMTHTPGFEDYSNKIFTLHKHEMLPLNEYVKENLPKRIFPAGEVAAYSNYGTALAGYIVERISGKPFSEYINEYIFKPLDMAHSTLEQPIPNHLSNDMTKAYRYVNDQYKKAKFEYMPGPAGGMSSTSPDIAKFMNVYLNKGIIKGEQFLESETIKSMFARQATQHSALDGMGLGFIENTFHEKRTLSHGGSTMLFDSGLYLIPEENIGIFMTYSGADFQFHQHVFKQFMNQYFSVTEKSNPTLSNDAEKRSKQFVGEFHQNGKSLTTDEKSLNLIMGTIRIKLKQEGYLAVTHNGTTNLFVESEQGIYKNISEEKIPYAYGNFQTIVFEEDSQGNILLTTDGPMTYSKSSWYNSTSFTFSTLIISLLLIIGTIIMWSITGIIRLIRKHPKHERSLYIAKLIVTSYGLLLMILVGSVAVTGEVDPIYLLPKDAYMPTPDWVQMTDWIFYIILLIGPVIILLTIIAWVKDCWKFKIKIHFSLLSCAIILLNWMFYYWNLF